VAGRVGIGRAWARAAATILWLAVGVLGLLSVGSLLVVAAVAVAARRALVVIKLWPSGSR